MEKANENFLSIIFLCGDIAKMGGTERAIINLANCLVNLEKCKIIIVSAFSTGEEKISYKLDNNVKVYHMQLHAEKYVIRIISYFKLVKKIESIIAENNVKIVVGTTHAFNCIITFINSNVKKVGWEHVIYEECPAISNICRIWRYRQLDRLIVLTKDEIPKYSFMEFKKIQVIYNPVSFDCDCISSLENKRIIYVGRLEEIKRVDLLVSASVIIKKAIADWKIDIYGNGSEKEKIKELINKNGLEDFITIYKPVSDIKEEYLNSSIIVLTSRSEGLPMVLIEAQTCGLPIVSFNCPSGPKEIINDGVDGFLVEQGNIDELAERVILLAKDKELRKKMGCCAKQNSSRFSKIKIVKEWHSIFESLLLK